jgi:hypothetical protein
VVRTTGRSAPKPWPGLLIVAGVAAFAVLEPLGRFATRHQVNPPEWAFALLLFVGCLSAMAGVVLGTGWISYTIGRLLHRTARHPSALLAARRLMADPWSGSRTFAALLTCVTFGAGAAGIRQWLVAYFAAEDQITSQPRDTTSYFNGVDLADRAVWVATAVAVAGLPVALTEGIAARRRAYTALIATGVPRATLSRSILWQVFAPLVPAVLLALAVGTALSRGVAAGDRAAGSGSQSCTPDGGCITATVAAIGIPFGELALLGAATLTAALTVVGLSLLFLRSSTNLDELRTT